MTKQFRPAVFTDNNGENMQDSDFIKIDEILKNVQLSITSLMENVNNRIEVLEKFQESATRNIIKIFEQLSDFSEQIKKEMERLDARCDEQVGNNMFDNRKLSKRIDDLMIKDATQSPLTGVS